MMFLSSDRATGSRLAAPCNRFLPRLLLLLSIIAASARSRTSSSEDRQTGLIGSALGLQCPPCERVHCSPRRPSRLRCRGGIVRGVCSCCPVCAKLEGDSCGGKWNYLGRCDVGLYCDTAQPVIAAASKTASSSQDYKDRDNWLLKTEGYCRKGKKMFSLLSLLLLLFLKTASTKPQAEDIEDKKAALSHGEPRDAAVNFDT